MEIFGKFEEFLIFLLRTFFFSSIISTSCCHRESKYLTVEHMSCIISEKRANFENTFELFIFIRNSLRSDKKKRRERLPKR